MFLSEQSLYVKLDECVGSTSKQNLGSVYDDDACEYIYHHRVHTTHTQYNIFSTQGASFHFYLTFCVQGTFNSPNNFPFVRFHFTNTNDNNSSGLGVVCVVLVRLLA